jgi:hypothetical protein
MVDRGVRPLLQSSLDPLILAGVTREVRIYEKINTYPRLMKELIHGSPGALGRPKLFEAAVRIAIPGFEKTPAQLGEKLEAAAGRGLLLTDPDAIFSRQRKRDKSRTCSSIPKSAATSTL